MRERWEAIRGVRALIFDLGGTVVSIDHERVRLTLARRGLRPDGDWVGRAERAGREATDRLVRGGAAGADVWLGFFGAFLGSAGVEPEAVPEVFAELEEFHRRHHLWRRVLPGVPEALALLGRAGYRLAALSNSDGRAEWLLGQVGLAREFEFVIDSEEVGLEKPDPRIFALAAERLDLSPGECAYVGDLLSIDVDGALAAGMRAILLDHWGSYTANGLPEGVPRAVEASEIPAGLRAAPAAEHGDGT